MKRDKFAFQPEKVPEMSGSIRKAESVRTLQQQKRLSESLREGKGIGPASKDDLSLAPLVQCKQQGHRESIP